MVIAVRREYIMRNYCIRLEFNDTLVFIFPCIFRRLCSSLIHSICSSALISLAHGVPDTQDKILTGKELTKDYATRTHKYMVRRLQKADEDA